MPKKKPKCGNLWCDGKGQLIVPPDRGILFVNCPYCQRIEMDATIKKLREALAPFAALCGTILDDHPPDVCVQSFIMRSHFTRAAEVAKETSDAD